MSTSPRRAPGPTLQLRAASRQTLADTVARQILDATADMPAGSRLPPERELTAQLEVSRTTLREALRGLVAIGVLETRHGSGVYVRDRSADVAVELVGGAPTPAEMRDLLEARRLLEVELAGLAAARRDGDDVAKLQAVLADHARQLESGALSIIAASEFHVLVLGAARNRFLANVLGAFFRIAIEHGPALYETVPGYRQWEYAEHRGIFEAIREGDVALARGRMSAHVEAMHAHYAAAFADGDAP